MLTMENIETRYIELLNTSQWKQLVSDFLASEQIIIIANGGGFAVASHGAADINRLTNKTVLSLDNSCYLTSVANDYGYNNIFVKWLRSLESKNALRRPTMVIGLSGSGNSKNVISTLDWADQNGYKAALISGQKSISLDSKINEIACNFDYFHTHEIISLMMFYELIHEAGGQCPTVKEEVIRKSKAPLAWRGNK